MDSTINESRFRLIRAANVWVGDQGWELLYYYNLYRLGLALVLLTLSSPALFNPESGFGSWTLAISIVGFFLVSVVAFFCIKIQSPAIQIQAHALFLVDILLISFITFSNSLHDTNIAVFFITTVAATAVMFRTKTALGYASIATLIIFAKDIVDVLLFEGSYRDFYIAALTALGFHAIVLVVSRLAQQTQVVQQALEQQELDLADLDDINQMIVDHLEIGILFLDDELGIKLINDNARELVGDYIESASVTGKLATIVQKYPDMLSGKQFTFRHGSKVLELSSNPLRNGLLVRIVDRTQISKKIQDTKLSSVGRLASAISHEIRNPLNAINHAAQLLKPEFNSQENDELIDIIRKHVKRIDNIIESIMERSRPGKVYQKEIDLESWLDSFIETFQQTLGGESVSISHYGEPVSVVFDPTQLEQILTNLCQNSRKYAQKPNKTLDIAFHTGSDQNSVPYLDIIDNGDPIPEQLIDRMFEPFYTSDSKSTGLGLYLSREFCRLNGSDLEYYNDQNSHGFRIVFKGSEDE